MVLLVLAASFTFVVSLILGYIVLRSDTFSRLNIIFFLITLSIAIWSLSAMMSYTTEQRETMIIMFKFSVLSVGLYVALLLHFSLEITQNVIHRSIFLNILLYIPFLLFIVVVVPNTAYFRDFYRQDNLWHYNHQYNSLLFIFYMSYWSLYNGISIFLLFRSMSRTESQELKRQYRVLGWSLSLSVALSFSKALLLPMLWEHTPRGGTLSFQLIWLFSLVFLVDRYRFLQPIRTAERLGLIEMPGYSLIILDRFRRVQILNREAELLLGIKKGIFTGQPVEKFIHPAEPLLQELGRLEFQEEHDSFSTTMQVKSANAGHVAVHCRVTILRDALGGAHSFLLTLGALDRRLKLLNRYNLSEREIDVLELIINGYSNRQIADRLYITERTVKTHISHIFQKMGVENRVKAVLLLKEDGLISEQTADREVLLLK